MLQEMTTLARELLEDAKLKLAAKEKLPEAEDQMTAPVKKLAQGVRLSLVQLRYI